LYYNAISAVPVLVGVYAGSLCYDKFDRKTYLKVIYVLLVAMGCLLIGSAFLTE
jgi:uncharacterized membrane protein YfcA